MRVQGNCRVLFRFAAFVILPLLGWAQALTLRPSLQVGDEFEIEFIRSREDARRPQTNGKSRTVVHVRVLEASPKGFVLDWRQGATSVTNPEIVKNPVAAAAANAVKDLRLEVVLDPNGSFAGLRNQAEVTAKLQSVIENLLASFRQQLPDAQQRQAVEALVHRLMAPPVLLAAASGDVQTYFGLHGAIVTKGKPVENSIHQASPLGAGTIPATFRVALESLDAHNANLTSTTTYDPRALAALTKQLLAQAPPGTVPTPFPTLEMSDTGRYVYNRSFGLMNEINITRRVTADEGNTRLDGREIRLLTRPAR